MSAPGGGAALQPFALLARHYEPDGAAFGVLAVHSVLVAHKAMEIARAWLERHPEGGLDLAFIEEAALLHDIGIRWCDAPEIFCFGSEPYVRHGLIGRELLERENLPRHALVCERHSGSGISLAEVLAEKLPLPARDYLPLSLEEKIICVADKFFSKDPERQKLWREKRLEKIESGLAKWGTPTMERWQALKDEFLPQR